MSLKAKIEAVIYAAEEPVTLAQLASLLGHEAQAELDRLAAHQASLPLDAAAEPTEIELPGEPHVLHEHPEADPNGEPDREPPLHPEDASAASGGDERRKARERERRLREHFRYVLDQLIRDYAGSDRGLEIREVANGFRLATKPEYHDAVRGFAKSLKPPLKLTLQALETLAVVAYKQPVTAPEVAEIRGVDSSGVLGSLLARKLVTTAGRKQVIGRPILYKTTKDFLVRFGLKDIAELPSIEEFEKMAGELAESDAVQEEMSMSSPPPSPSGETDAVLPSATAPADAELLEEKDATEPQADGDSEALTPLPGDAPNRTSPHRIPPDRIPPDRTPLDGGIAGIADEPSEVEVGPSSIEGAVEENTASSRSDNADGLEHKE